MQFSYLIGTGLLQPLVQQIRKKRVKAVPLASIVEGIDENVGAFLIFKYRVSRLQPSNIRMFHCSNDRIA
jgi:hypothetical protein